MLEGRDIIVFADDWGGHPSTMQHIGQILARNNRLLWLGSFGLRKATWSMRDVQRAWGKLKRMINPGPRSETGIPMPAKISHMQPAVLPFHDIRMIRDYNMRLIRHAILREYKRLNFRRPVLLTSSPLIAPLIGSLEESSSHYLCLDDFTLFEGAFACLAPLEQELCARVDSVFSVSEILRRSRIPPSGEGHFFPQGVDTDHFCPLDGPLPEAVAALRKPIIGFFGLVSSWVDVPLLLQIALRYPASTIVIIGKSAVDLACIREFPNIVWLGEIPYSMLPLYARAFDVGLIPFIVNDLTLASNPLKLLEYLALGIPVVSSDLPEVRRFEPLVYVAKDHESFIALVGRALSDGSSRRSMERRTKAMEYSWSSLTGYLSTVIEGIEATKESDSER